MATLFITTYLILGMIYSIFVLTTGKEEIQNQINIHGESFKTMLIIVCVLMWPYFVIKDILR